MAVNVESSSTAYSPSGTTLTINKPTGLAVGDLMIAGVRSENSSVTLPSGWTNIATTFNPVNFVLVCYKYADSSDVAASNFTWTAAGSAVMGGGILRVSLASNIIGSAYNTGGVSNTATPSFATGITPTRANSLIVMFIWSISNTNQSLGGYAIATSNPTWTEAFDFAMDSNTNMACAWAIRPQTTSTGAWSCTGGTATSDYNSIIVSINEKFVVDVAETTTLTESVKGDISSYYDESVDLDEDVETSKSRLWIKDTKPTTAWENDKK